MTSINPSYAAMSGPTPYVTPPTAQDPLGPQALPVEHGPSPDPYAGSPAAGVGIQDTGAQLNTVVAAPSASDPSVVAGPGVPGGSVPMDPAFSAAPMPANAADPGSVDVSAVNGPPVVGTPGSQVPDPQAVLTELGATPEEVAAVLAANLSDEEFVMVAEELALRQQATAGGGPPGAGAQDAPGAAAPRGAGGSRKQPVDRPGNVTRPASSPTAKPQEQVGGFRTAMNFAWQLTPGAMIDWAVGKHLWTGEKIDRGLGNFALAAVGTGIGGFAALKGFRALQGARTAKLAASSVDGAVDGAGSVRNVAASAGGKADDAAAAAPRAAKSGADAVTGGGSAGDDAVRASGNATAGSDDVATVTAMDGAAATRVQAQERSEILNALRESTKVKVPSPPTPFPRQMSLDDIVRAHRRTVVANAIDAKAVSAVQSSDEMLYLAQKNSFSGRQLNELAERAFDAGDVRLAEQIARDSRMADDLAVGMGRVLKGADAGDLERAVAAYSRGAAPDTAASRLAGRAAPSPQRASTGTSSGSGATAAASSRPSSAPVSRPAPPAARSALPATATQLDTSKRQVLEDVAQLRNSRLPAAARTRLSEQRFADGLRKHADELERLASHAKQARASGTPIADGPMVASLTRRAGTLRAEAAAVTRGTFPGAAYRASLGRAG